MNLAEQLRVDGERFARSSWSDQAVLMIQAADALDAKDRLLALAETLAGAVTSIKSSLSDRQSPAGPLKDAIDARNAFKAAQAEYASGGKVPCGEPKPVRDYESEIWLLRTNCGDLRRQLAEAEAKLRTTQEHEAFVIREMGAALAAKDSADKMRGHALVELGVMQNEKDSGLFRIDALEEQLEQAQADNAVLVEALDKIATWHEKSIGLIEANYTASRVFLRELRGKYLSQPHPGTPMLEELAALRAVVEAARSVNTAIRDYGRTYDENGRLSEALAALDAHERKEQADV